MKTNAFSIDKYCGVTRGCPALTYTKKNITHGSPGTGNTYVGQRSVLYSLTKGLQTISTSLMAARANAIGSTHLQKLFCWSNLKDFAHLHRCAEFSLENIRRKNLIHHILLTVDVIFIDEAGQLSAEQLAILTLFFRS